MVSRGGSLTPRQGNKGTVTVRVGAFRAISVLLERTDVSAVLSLRHHFLPSF